MSRLGACLRHLVRRGRPDSRPGRSPDAGDTLVEILIAVSIIAIAAAGIIGGVASAIGSSGTHRSLSTLDDIVKSFAQTAKYDIQQQPSGPGVGPLFQPCAGTIGSSSAYYTLASVPYPSSGPVGTAVTVFGTGFVGSPSITLTSSLGTTIVGGVVGRVSNGALTATFIIPSSLNPGSATIPVRIQVSDGSDSAYAAASFNVTPTTATPPVASSPLTQYQIGISSIQYWNGTQFTSDQSGCQNNHSRSDQLQQLAITASTLGAYDQLNIVVADPNFIFPPTTVTLATSFTPFFQGASPPDATVGNTLTITATVGPPVVPPTGVITWTVAGPGIPPQPCGPSTLGAGPLTCTIRNARQGTYAVTATYGGDTNYTGSSGTIAIPVYPAAQLVFTTQPGGVGSTGGLAFKSQPVVEVEDARGNPATSNTDPIGLAITPGTPTPAGNGQLSCGTSNETAGVTTFSGCSINTAGHGYELTASDGALTGTSQPFDISVGPAAHLVFTQQPGGDLADGNPTGGVAFPSQPIVTIVDAGGNPVTTDRSTVGLAIKPGTPLDTHGGQLSCGISNEAAGVTTFSGCSINTAGTAYQLTASDGALTVDSQPFTVIVGPATHLAFTQQPGGNVTAGPPTGGAAFPNQPQVTVEDAGGNPVTTDGSMVNLVITTGTPSSGGPGTLSGCVGPNVSGVVTFTGCQIDATGTNYQLTASDGTLRSATSQAFTVGVGPAAQLAFTRQPGGTSTGGRAIGTQPAVIVEDAGGNPVTTDISTVTLTITSGTPGTGGPGRLTGCVGTETAGVTTFSGCTINTAGTGYQLTARDPGLTPAVSQPFDIGVGPAAQLAFTQQPSASTPGVAFPTQPQVTIEDAGGNAITTDASAVTLTITPGTPTSGGPGALSGCIGPNVSGVVTFTGCQIDTTGAGYQVTAHDGTLSAAYSAGFNIT